VVVKSFSSFYQSGKKKENCIFCKRILTKVTFLVSRPLDFRPDGLGSGDTQKGHSELEPTSTPSAGSLLLFSCGVHIWLHDGNQFCRK